jgi:O-antigen ligase
MIAQLSLIIYLFSSFIRPADWYAPLLGKPVDYYIAFLMLAVAIVSLKFLKIGDLLKQLPTQLLLAYYVAMMLSSLFAGDMQVFSTQLSYYSKFIFFYFIFALFCQHPNKIKWTLFFAILLVAIVGYQGIVQYKTGTNWAIGIEHWAGKYDRIRWTGMYNGPNVFSILLIFGLIPAIQFIIGPWKWIYKIASLICSISIFTAIILTNSRGGYLELLVVVVLSIFLNNFKKEKKFSLLKIGVVGAVLFALLTFAPSRMSTIKDSEGSASGRIDSWDEGIKMLKANPVLGVGVGNWQKEHHLLAHNSFVQTMGETGLVGLFFWLATIYAFMRGLLRLLFAAEDKFEHNLVSTLIIELSGLLATSVFLSTEQFDLWYILFGMISALMVYKNITFDLRLIDIRRIAVIEALGIISVSIAIRLYY